ncbi:KilA-N domain-containing protein [Leptothrix discophora]|uniref:KilA-N domain-containing protein n=1 Tax=Leptothrix discophora TaxID=89 RepID=UPI002737CA70|nr:KilA-N domain-containing protein [Leptothrix discophora]
MGDAEVRQLDGLFSLNDLHAAAGNLPKDRPQQFLRREETKALIVELDNQCADSRTALRVVNGGTAPGTYACRELVIAYAAWISAAFHLKVIRVFLAQPGATVAAPAAAPEPLRRRWLTEQHGNDAPVTVSLGEDVHLGTWIDLAGELMRAHGRPVVGMPSHADALALASAAAQPVALTVQQLPKGRGEDIARAIHADSSLSVADLHRIAEMASTQLWVRTRGLVRAQGQDPDRALFAAHGCTRGAAS